MNHNEHVAQIAAMARREFPDEAKHVFREELRPIVRQALTEDVLRAVDRLVGLTPKAVEAIEEDLASEDRTIRQRAYSLLVKYTIGHPALVKHEDAVDSGQLVVNFNLPRPEPQEPLAEPEVIDVDPLRPCDVCKQEKPASEFVAGSDRCQVCLDEWKARIFKEFAS